MTFVPPKVWRPVEGRVCVEKTQYVTPGVVRGLLPAGSHVEVVDQYIKVARRHLVALTHALADKYGRCEVWLDFEEHVTCTTSCQTAKGPVEDCTCGCHGLGHRGGQAPIFGDGAVRLHTGTGQDHYVVTRQGTATPAA